MGKFRSGTDCRWGITLERGADDRWRLFSTRNKHSHELPSAQEDALGGQKLLRDGIPQEFEAIGEMLAAAGVEPSKINLVLQINAQKRGMPITWTYQDVRHRFGATSEELRLDAESLTSWIRMRRDDLRLAGDWRLRESRVAGCFFEFRGALLAYQAIGVRPCDGRSSSTAPTTRTATECGFSLSAVSAGAGIPR